MNTLVAYAPAISRDSASRYDVLMSVLRDRCTAREFDRGYRMPRSHIEMILDAAATAPSGANAQPWHYVVVTHTQKRRLIADAMIEDYEKRAAGGGAVHRIDYNAMTYAPGFFVILADPRLTWAFPGLMTGSELDQRYHAHAEQILLQSVAASTMAAHLAATALGYHVWWVSALGQEAARAVVMQELGVPADLRVIDFMLFGPALSPPPRRWKKTREEIASWDRFDMNQFRNVEQIDAWMADVRGQMRVEDEAVEFLPGKGK
jgi:nitroreductase